MSRYQFSRGISEQAMLDDRSCATIDAAIIEAGFIRKVLGATIYVHDTGALGRTHVRGVYTIERGWRWLVECKKCRGTGELQKKVSNGTPNNWVQVNFPCTRCNGQRLVEEDPHE